MLEYLVYGSGSCPPVNIVNHNWKSWQFQSAGQACGGTFLKKDILVVEDGPPRFGVQRVEAERSPHPFRRGSRTGSMFATRQVELNPHPTPNLAGLAIIPVTDLTWYNSGSSRENLDFWQMIHE